MRLLIIPVAILAASFMGDAIAQTLIERAGRDEIAYMGQEEPAMRAAFGKAKATLEEFLAAAAQPRLGTSAYSIKVAISDGKNTEYFWVTEFSRQGTRFHGVLSNVPRLVKRHTMGERIEFDQAQIADWTYLDGSRMLGNFTACALLTKEPPAQAEDFKRLYGLRCD